VVTRQNIWAENAGKTDGQSCGGAVTTTTSEKLSGHRRVERGLKRVGSKGFDPLENWTWGLSLLALTMADRPLKAIKRSGMRLTSAQKKGGNLNKKRWAGRAGMVVFVFGITFVYPATAQVTFGSPDDSPRVALSGGAFDVLPDTKKPGAGATGLALSEYRFGDLLWIVAPFIGVMGTGKGAFYGYGGLGFDIVLVGRWIITPTAAIGYFGHGTGIDLGAHTEFRTGAEFNYRFDNLVRLGVGFYHMSNAGIGSQNPGAELVTLALTVPLR